ncbi:glycosyltransferase family 2 protein [Salinarimonas ramus]|uniref:Succinoglycan biosynthesis protein ExoO n=1 Tax=Salinarimonas ramus TaxID=690164 RepID=A0A917QA62_9HYPH|nr:glycosyltransferase family 2 protein [Salinarimonas ramus]GGK38125.1 succinoglycan biosynthesis protein ExoO [Salinarimonas ramus]
MQDVEVSYLVPAFRAAETIETAVRSALAQENIAIEVVVADDASNDGTAETVERLAGRDPRIRLVRLPENGGPSPARNAAMAAARGRFLAVLDADDTLEPGRTRALLDLATLTGADVVADDLVRLDASGEPVSRALPEGPAPYSFVVDAPRYLEDNVPMAGRFGTGYLKPMVRADFVAAHALAYDPAVRIGEDFLFWLDALLAGGRYVVSSQAGYRYCARPGSLSHRIVPGRLRELEDGLDRVVARHASAEADPTIAVAMAGYRAGLSRARAYLDAVETAKAGRPVDGIVRLGRAPALWPLAWRYGGEAIGARIAGRRRRA